MISNGLLLHRHPDLPAVLRDTDTCLKISIHHRSPQYRQRLQPVLELAEAWVAHQGIRLEYIFSYLNWTRRYQGFGSAMAPFDDKQPRLSWENCPAKGCAQLFEGKLWKLSLLAYLPLQAGKYNLSDKWKPYLAYRPLPPDCTPDELKAFFARQEEPYCGDVREHDPAAGVASAIGCFSLWRSLPLGRIAALNGQEGNDTANWNRIPSLADDREWASAGKGFGPGRRDQHSRQERRAGIAAGRVRVRDPSMGRFTRKPVGEGGLPELRDQGESRACPRRVPCGKSCLPSTAFNLPGDAEP